MKQALFSMLDAGGDIVCDDFGIPGRRELEVRKLRNIKGASYHPGIFLQAIFPEIRYSQNKCEDKEKMDCNDSQYLSGDVFFHWSSDFKFKNCCACIKKPEMKYSISNAILLYSNNIRLPTGYVK